MPKMPQKRTRRTNAESKAAIKKAIRLMERGKAKTDAEAARMVGMPEGTLRAARSRRPELFKDALPAKGGGQRSEFVDAAVEEGIRLMRLKIAKTEPEAARLVGIPYDTLRKRRIKEPDMFRGTPGPEIRMTNEEVDLKVREAAALFASGKVDTLKEAAARVGVRYGTLISRRSRAN